MPKDVAAESHHRVKNTLQSIIALIGIVRSPDGGLDSSHVQRLVSHVQNLSSLHDALYDAALQSESVKILELVTLLQKTLPRFSDSVSLKGTLITETRIVSSVALAMGDILIAIELGGASTIEILGENVHDDRYLIDIVWQNGATARELLDSAQLALAKMVLAGEVQSDLIEGRLSGSCRNLSFYVRRYVHSQL